MRFFRRIAGLLGFARDNDNGHDGDEEEDGNKINGSQATNPQNYRETGLPRKGFGVKVQVPVDRPHHGPIIVPCTSGDGGVQGLQWYAKRLRIDEDGDVADEFLDEVLPQTMTPSAEQDQNKPLPKFEVRYTTTQAKVKNQVISSDGRIKQCVEYKGRLQWV